MEFIVQVCLLMDLTGGPGLEGGAPDRFVASRNYCLRALIVMEPTAAWNLNGEHENCITPRLCGGRLLKGSSSLTHIERRYLMYLGQNVINITRFNHSTDCQFH